MHKKSSSHEASAEHESRSISRCSSKRELTTADGYGFRPSLKNLEKLDLMPDHEVAEIEDVWNSRSREWLFVWLTDWFLKRFVTLVK